MQHPMLFSCMTLITVLRSDHNLRCHAPAEAPRPPFALPLCFILLMSYRT